MLRCACTSSCGVSAIHCANETSMNRGARNGSRNRNGTSPVFSTKCAIALGTVPTSPARKSNVHELVCAPNTVMRAVPAMYYCHSSVLTPDHRSVEGVGVGRIVSICPLRRTPPRRQDRTIRLPVFRNLDGADAVGQVGGDVVRHYLAEPRQRAALEGLLTFTPECRS